MKKKILSIFLACVCLLGVVGSASAANYQITPRSTLFSTVIEGDPGNTQYQAENLFHTVEGDGTYLRVWFENYNPNPCTLYLYSADMKEKLGSVKIPGRPEDAGDDEQYGDFLVYRCTDAEKDYIIKIQMSYEVPGSRATVYGYLAVTQNISL